MKHDDTAFAPTLTSADRHEFIGQVLAMSLSGRDQITLTAEGASFLASAAAANQRWEYDRIRFERAAADAEKVAYDIGQELDAVRADLREARSQRNLFALSALTPWALIIGALVLIFS